MPEPWSYPIRLFERTGVELEYMIVDAETLAVKPIADEALKAITGEYATDAEPDGPDGLISWSNELALHVIELKTTNPVATLDEAAPVFVDHVGRVNAILEPMGARLMPGAMHPWMNPHEELRLWPHEYNRVYEAFNRIFSCEGHGWANLQSTHINLPFGSDDEFGRLHAAMRLVLPILPALAASSPMMDGAVTGLADTRLEVYRSNARRVPSVSGLVVPERVFTRHDYETKLLGSLYRDIAPHDIDGILQHEWLNARGCIARFDRGSIEIRVLDIQENPIADLAIVALVNKTLQALAEEQWATLEEQQSWEVEPLHGLLLRTIREGETARIDDPAYLELFRLRSSAGVTAGEFWSALAERFDLAQPWREHLRLIAEHGTLSTRLRRSLGADPSRERINSVYRALCDCLASNEPFLPGA
ncbi:MAG: glutamate-cysteine ligase family protein [Phycisphaerales bacterium]